MQAQVCITKHPTYAANVAPLNNIINDFARAAFIAVSRQVQDVLPDGAVRQVWIELRLVLAQYARSDRGVEFVDEAYSPLQRGGLEAPLALRANAVDNAAGPAQVSSCMCDLVMDSDADSIKEPRHVTRRLAATHLHVLQYVVLNVTSDQLQHRTHTVAYMPDLAHRRERSSARTITCHHRHCSQRARFMGVSSLAPTSQTSHAAPQVLL